jgi:hypothetical protein
VFSDINPVGVAQLKAGPGSAAAVAVGRGVGVAAAVVAGVVVGVADEDVVEADATVVTATVVTTRSALSKARTMTPPFGRRLECNPRATAAKRSGRDGSCGLCSLRCVSSWPLPLCCSD